MRLKMAWLVVGLLCSVVGLQGGCGPVGGEGSVAVATDFDVEDGTKVGTGDSGLVFWPTREGVLVQIGVPESLFGTAAPNAKLSITGNIAESMVTVSLATGPDGRRTSTAGQVALETAAIIRNGGFALDALLLRCSFTGSGTGLVEPLAQPMWLRYVPTSERSDLQVVP